MSAPRPLSDCLVPETPRLQLRILATSDLHGHILPWDDLADAAAPDRGLATVATLISKARSEAAACVLLDNGDFLNGSPLADHIAETWPRSRRAVHPVVAAMNALGYDAATLGNHEFSHGLGHVRAALRQAGFPIINSNLDRLAAKGARSFARRSVLLHRDLFDETGGSHRLAIGVLGFLPPQTVHWERRHLAGKLQARDILASARRAVPLLRRAGADIVIVLAHSGLGQTGLGQIGTDQPKDEATELVACENVAAALALMPGVDAVVAGHTHQTFPNSPKTGPGTGAAPLVMPGHFGSHLGVIDLSLEHSPQGWQVASHRAEVRAVSCREGPTGRITALAACDPAIAAFALQESAEMRRNASMAVGQTKVPLHSYFALLGHSPVQSLLADAQAVHMRTLLQGRPEAALPMLSSVAPFKAGGRGGPANYTDIPAGPLTVRNITDLYLHPNSAVALKITGHEVASWLERSVSLFHQVTSGSRDAPLIDQAFPAHNFDMIQGLSYQIDLSQPARFNAAGLVVNPDAIRVTNLCHNGSPVDPSAEFLLITNSYRASGGAGFAGALPSRIVFEDDKPLRRVLQDHVARQASVSPPAKLDWGFASMPGTTVVFDSGEGAGRFASAIPGLAPVGLLPTGFLHFRLAL